MLADLAYRRALAYKGGKDVFGEVAWLRRAAALAPDRDLYTVALGLGLADEARLERNPADRRALLEAAERALGAATARSPLDPYNWLHAAEVHELRAEAERQPAAREAAIVSYDRAATLSPQRALFFDAAGRALQAAGRHAEALARFEAAGRLRGPEGERAAYIGNSLAALGRDDEAMNSYRVALRLAPRSAPAHAGLALLLERHGDLPAALEQARLATRYQFRDWHYRELLSRLELTAGDRAAALVQARAAARLAPVWEQERLRALVDQLRAPR